MNKQELRDELVNVLKGCPRRPKYEMEDLVDTLITGISDDLCKRLTNSTMVMKGQMINLANMDRKRLEDAEAVGAAGERARCARIMVDKYKWNSRRAINAFRPKDSE
jgi:hypothetical protein